jgi:hypothetical protein
MDKCSGNYSKDADTCSKTGGGSHAFGVQCHIHECPGSSRVKSAIQSIVPIINPDGLAILGQSNTWLRSISNNTRTQLTIQGRSGEGGK